jgi:hypothetical protein
VGLGYPQANALTNQAQTLNFELTREQRAERIERKSGEKEMPPISLATAANHWMDSGIGSWCATQTSGPRQHSVQRMRCHFAR